MSSRSVLAGGQYRNPGTRRAVVPALAVLILGSCAAPYGRYNPTVAVDVRQPPRLGFLVEEVVFAPPGRSAAPADRSLLAQLEGLFTRSERLDPGICRDEWEQTLTGMFLEGGLRVATHGNHANADAMIGIDVTSCVVVQERAQTTREVIERVGDNTRRRDVPEFHARTQLDFRALFEVTDLSNNRLAASRTLNFEPELIDSSPEGYPDYPTNGTVLQLAYALAAEEIGPVLLEEVERRDLIFFDEEKCGLNLAFKALDAGERDRALQLSLANVESCRPDPAAAITLEDLAAAHYNVGVLYRVMGDFDSALGSLERAAAADPANSVIAEAIDETISAEVAAAALGQAEQEAADRALRRAEDLAARADDVITNGDIVAMLNDGLPDEIIIRVIETSVVDFDVSPRALGEFSRQGLRSAPVISAMMAATGDVTAAAAAGDAGPASQATAEDPDRAVLVALYEATDGPNWDNNDGWLTDAPLRDWFGVETDGSGRVFRLDLGADLDEEALDLISSGNKLTGYIPPELGSLAHLTELSLADNNLSGPIPPELGNLVNLQRLSLDRNNLSGPVPPELGSLANLRRLSLAENPVSGPIPPELGNLVNLEWLGLFESRLSGPIPPELGSLANLRVLGLASTDLSGPIPPELGNLVNLRALALRGSGLSGPIPSSFLRLNELAVLSLEGNSLCVAETPAFEAWLQGIEDSNGDDLSPCVPGHARVAGAVSAQVTPTVGDAGDDHSCARGSETPLSIGESIRATLSESDEDCFVVDVGRPDDTAPFGLTVHTEGDTDTYGTLYNSDRSELSSDDDGGSGTNFRIVRQVEAGTYHVQVRGWDESVTGSYVLRVSASSDNPTTDRVLSNAGAEQPDRAALVAFYEATGGPNWRNNDGWLTDAPLESWFGVVTDESGRLREVDLQENGLSGSLPPELGDLVDLERLQLTSNQLSGSIPRELGNLVNLTELWLDGNELSGLIPPELGNLVNLKELWLSFNNLEGPIPPELGNLVNLTRLVLGANRLSGPIPSSFLQLNQLSELYLFSGYDFSTFAPHPSPCVPATSAFATWLEGISVDDADDLPPCDAEDEAVSGAAPERPPATTGKAGRAAPSAPDSVIARWGLPDGALARLGRGSMEGFAFTPDGRWLVISSSVGLWYYDMTTAEPVALEAKGMPPEGGDDAPDRTVFEAMRWMSFKPGMDVRSKDGTTLAGAVGDTIRVRDAYTGEIRFEARLGEPVQALAFSTDPFTLAAASDIDIVVWREQEDGSIRESAFSGHRDPVRALRILSNGSTLASATVSRVEGGGSYFDSGEIRHWDLDGGRADDARPLVFVDWACCLDWSNMVFSPDGSMLAAGSFEAVLLWDAASGQPMTGLDAFDRGANIVGIAFSPDGGTIGVRWSDDPRYIVLSEVASGTFREVGSEDHLTVTPIGISIDGATLATVGEWNAPYLGQSTWMLDADEVQLWDTRTGHRYSSVSFLASNWGASRGPTILSPDLTTMASAWSEAEQGGYESGGVTLHDIRTGERMELGHDNGVYALTFSPDGRILASWMYAEAASGEVFDEPIRLWDVATGELLLASSADTVASLSNPATGEPIARIANGTVVFAGTAPPGIVAPEVFATPDGDTLWRSPDGTVEAVARMGSILMMHAPRRR